MDKLVPSHMRASLPNDAFQFYTQKEYYQDIVQRIDETGPGDRVALATLAFEPNTPGIGKIVRALCSAAQRGADVSLSVDAFTFLTDDTRHWHRLGPLFFFPSLPRFLPPASRHKLDALEKLKACGVRYAILNKPGRAFTNPFAGRAHIKFTIINDRVYIGGCNLAHVSNLDMMVAWDDPGTAGWLLDIADRMLTAGNAMQALQGKDARFIVDEKATLLADAGQPKRSIIFDTALQLIDEAEESIFLTCQYFPHDSVASHLQQAHDRGVKITIAYNSPRKQPWPYPLVHYVVRERERRRRPASFFEHELPKSADYLHVKLLATEKGAMIGSHNYVVTGVNFGTAEIALLRRDAQFAAQATALTRSYLKLS